MRFLVEAHRKIFRECFYDLLAPNFFDLATNTGSLWNKGVKFHIVLPFQIDPRICEKPASLKNLATHWKDPTTVSMVFSILRTWT